MKTVVRKGKEENHDSEGMGVFSVQKFGITDEVNSIFSLLLLIQDQSVSLICGHISMHK